MALEHSAATTVPDRPHLAYQPALDGLRGIAIASVLLYHGGLGWSRGGFLGVDVFFVLSGFLITSLLVVEEQASGTIALGRFWARRARRLLPALFCLVAVVGIHQALAGPSAAVPGLGGDGLAALLYFGNWHQIWAGQGYFATTGPVSLLQHTWSLAIEEQFYVLWPLLVAGAGSLLLRWGHATATATATSISGARAPAGALGADRRRRRGLLLAGLATAGALLSALEMALLYGGGAGVDRVYYGTDTRAQDLLVGAALAFLLGAARTRDASRRPTLRRRVAVQAAGLAGLAGLVAAMGLANGGSAWPYRFGFFGAAICVAALIAAATSVGSPIGWVISWTPLRALGKISYGLYLWHFPLFLWLTPSATGLAGDALLAVRCAAAVAAATISYYVIEMPFRRGLVQRRVLAVLVAGGACAAAVSLVIASAVVVPEVLPAAAASVTHASAFGHGVPIGHGKCRVLLSDSKEYGKIFGSFDTCHPTRVLLVGDSIALTIGYGLGAGEERYSAEVFDEAIIGCGFGIRGETDAYGSFGSPYPACLDAFGTWKAEKAAVHPGVVVVEMGYWDCFDHLWDGQVVHVGEPAYDRYVTARMDLLIRYLGGAGTKIVLLSVPPVAPAPLADGSTPPSASPVRRAFLNSLLAKVAAAHPDTVRLVDLDPYVAPGGVYAAAIGGQPCRWADGIHFTTYCGERLRAPVFSATDELLGVAYRTTG